MTEYNQLTKRLLSEGFNATTYPADKVHIAKCGYLGSGDPLNNMYGGFEYNRIYCDSFVYETGCGMHVLGEHVISNMGYAGEEWCHENDNPVVRCMYDKSQCADNDPRLCEISSGRSHMPCWCVCHRTDHAYNYENSFEKLEKDRIDEKNKKYQEFSDAHGGRVCAQHMIFNERTREWEFKYNPEACARHCYSTSGYCPILNKQLSRKRGNVYYDLKKTGVRRDGTLFDGETWTYIEKGIRYFEKPCSIDICEAFVKAQSDAIRRKYMINHSTEFQACKELQVEILNVRAEARPSRDLLQDMEDIRNGITITHASDLAKREKEQKREKRQVDQQKKVKKLEKKILEVGYWNMDPYCLDRKHADKWIGMERIKQLEDIRNQKMKEEKEKPVQITLADFMEM